MSSNSEIAGRRFRIDAGPGDDEVDFNTVRFPNGFVMLGGDGTDFLHAPSNLVEHAARIDSFEERVIFGPAIESYPAPG